MTIGQHFVLNGAVPSTRIRAIDILSRMICDWSVVMLEEAVCDPTRGYLCRLYALSKIRRMLAQAISRGYDKIAPAQIDELTDEARSAIAGTTNGTEPVDIEPVAWLCSHLLESLADGVFSQLPDF